MIRVLHVTVGLGLGGMEKMTAQHVERLDRRRFDARVLALKGWGPLGDELRGAGVPVTTLDGRGLLDPGVLLRARDFFRRNAFDVVHSHLLWGNALACLFKRSNRVVWHEHDTDEWMGAGARWLERRVIGKCDRLLAISQAVAESVRRRAPQVADRIEVLPNAVRAERERPPDERERREARERLGRGPEELLIGTVGRLDEPKKGLSDLLEALPAVAQARPDVRLLIVGDGRDRRRLEKLAEANGMAARVTFLGERRDVRGIYPAFDVFAQPSRWEGFGITLLEAMEAALPAVAARVGGIPEVVEDGVTGVLVPPRDPAALAGALIRLLGAPEEARRFGEAGFRRLRERFDLDRNVRRLEEIYMEGAR